MDTDDLFDRVYKATGRFFTSPRFFAGTTIVAGLLALTVTLGAILQPMPAITRVTIIVTAVFFWLSTAVFFNFWRKWKVVVAWTQDREALQRKAERVNAYLAQDDAGKLPPEIRQDLQGLLDTFFREWRD